MNKYRSSVVCLVGLSIAFAASAANSPPPSEPRGLPFFDHVLNLFEQKVNNSLSFKYLAAMTNAGVEATATGSVDGRLNITRRTDKEVLTVSLANLRPNTAYQLNVFIADDVSSTNAASISTNASGAFTGVYMLGRRIRGGIPLPSVMQPIHVVRELDVVNASAQVVLRANLVAPAVLKYQATMQMHNAGFIPTASASIRIKATPINVQLQFTAKNLKPMTDYLFLINGVVYKTVTTNAIGRTKFSVIDQTLHVFDIRTIALTDKDGLHVVLVVYPGSGKGIIPPHNTVPAVMSTNPAGGKTGVPINTTVNAIFNEGMDPLTFNTSTFTLVQTVSGVSTSGNVTYSGTTAKFAPAGNLAPNTAYTATITTGVADLGGNTMPSTYSWNFTTGATADTTSPTVAFVNPADTATDVPLNRNIAATFSEEMDPQTITTATFTIAQGTTSVPGTVAYAGTTATFTPASNLASGTVYTATITTGAKDLVGNALASNYVWSFTTGAATVALNPVVLGQTSHFAVLAGYAITTVPGSAITGDVGISPAAESFITGFSQTDSTGYATSPQVTGKIYAADMASPTPDMLTQAKGDLTIAYNNAAAITPVPTGTFLNPGAGDLAGLNLVPGLYKFTGEAKATTDFTLTGGANDVWVFQVASALTVSNGVHVTLAGGATADNIFWQVGTQATLGTTVIFYGTIMADASVTLNTGATLNGRALAFSGTVALDQNVITVPAP